MRWSILAGAIALPLAALAVPDRPFAGPCQKGTASAPYIGADDMRAIDRAAATLPMADGFPRADVGSTVPASVKRASVPAAVAKVLPQYKDYSAFRTRTDLMIADPRGLLAYIMPLHGTATPANCP